MIIQQHEYNQVVDGLGMQLALQRRFSEELAYTNGRLQQRLATADSLLAAKYYESKTKKGKK